MNRSMYRDVCVATEKRRQVHVNIHIQPGRELECTYTKINVPHTEMSIPALIYVSASRRMGATGEERKRRQTQTSFDYSRYIYRRNYVLAHLEIYIYI